PGTVSPDHRRPRIRCSSALISAMPAMAVPPSPRIATISITGQPIAKSVIVDDDSCRCAVCPRHQYSAGPWRVDKRQQNWSRAGVAATVSSTNGSAQQRVEEGIAEHPAGSYRSRVATAPATPRGTSLGAPLTGHTDRYVLLSFSAGAHTSRPTEDRGRRPLSLVVRTFCYGPSRPSACHPLSKVGADLRRRSKPVIT